MHSHATDPILNDQIQAGLGGESVDGIHSCNWSAHVVNAMLLQFIRSLLHISLIFCIMCLHCVLALCACYLHTSPADTALDMFCMEYALCAVRAYCCVRSTCGHWSELCVVHAVCCGVPAHQQGRGHQPVPAQRAERVQHFGERI